MKVSDYLKEVIQIRDPELLALLEENSAMESYKARETIESLDKPEYNLRFLVSGAVRGYIIDKFDKETTTCFLTEPGVVITGLNYLEPLPSAIGFQALKESEVYSVPKATLITLAGRFPEIASLHIRIVTECLVYHYEARKMLYMKTAKQRYEWFLERFPELMGSVNHGYIASFLNITPVTLSRIRRDMDNR